MNDIFLSIWTSILTFSSLFVEKMGKLAKGANVAQRTLPSESRTFGVN